MGKKPLTPDDQSQIGRWYEHKGGRASGLWASYLHGSVNSHGRAQVKGPCLNINPFWICLAHKELVVTSINQHCSFLTVHVGVVALSMV